MPETITVPAGGHESFDVSDGNPLENVLIDISADGASCSITPSGSDWVVRNVGIKGQHPGGNYILKPSTDGRDGHGLVENLYAADGQKPRSGKGFCWVNHNRGNDGTITFRNVNIQGFVDNAIYGSSSAHKHNSGVVNLEDSLIRNNNISNFRAGTPDGRKAYVRNSVIEGTAERTPPCGVGCSAPGAQNPRGVWAWYGTVVIENSDVTGTPPTVTHEGGNIETRNSRLGSDANIGRIPQGVPTSAEQAAAGGGHGGTGESAGFLGGSDWYGSGGSGDVFAPDGGTQTDGSVGQQKVEIRGDGEYSFEVPGEVVSQQPIFGSESGGLTDGTVQGSVGEGDSLDTVTVTGPISNVQADDGVTVEGQTTPSHPGGSGSGEQITLGGLGELIEWLAWSGPVTEWITDNWLNLAIAAVVAAAGTWVGLNWVGNKVGKHMVKG